MPEIPFRISILPPLWEVTLYRMSEKARLALSQKPKGPTSSTVFASKSRALFKGYGFIGLSEKSTLVWSELISAKLVCMLITYLDPLLIGSNLYNVRPKDLQGFATWSGACYRP